mmetsp:Transcript_985/g.3494  ORF Transcript_985/g.3494 Transcript_985/m.3494 type:complete len:218 (+) Transcript_985:213-866(+)
MAHRPLVISVSFMNCMSLAAMISLGSIGSSSDSASLWVDASASSIARNLSTGFGVSIASYTAFWASGSKPKSLPYQDFSAPESSSFCAFANVTARPTAVALDRNDQKTVASSGEGESPTCSSGPIPVAISANAHPAKPTIAHLPTHCSAKGTKPNKPPDMSYPLERTIFTMAGSSDAVLWQVTVARRDLDTLGTLAATRGHDRGEAWPNALVLKGVL